MAMYVYFAQLIVRAMLIICVDFCGVYIFILPVHSYSALVAN